MPLGVRPSLPGVLYSACRRRVDVTIYRERCEQVCTLQFSGATGTWPNLFNGSAHWHTTNFLRLISVNRVYINFTRLDLLVGWAICVVYIA
jgi:hypothetical protein